VAQRPVEVGCCCRRAVHKPLPRHGLWHQPPSDPLGISGKVGSWDRHAKAPSSEGKPTSWVTFLPEFPAVWDTAGAVIAVRADSQFQGFPHCFGTQAKLLTAIRRIHIYTNNRQVPMQVMISARSPICLLPLSISFPPPPRLFLPFLLLSAEPRWIEPRPFPVIGTGTGPEDSRRGTIPEPGSGSLTKVSEWIICRWDAGESFVEFGIEPGTAAQSWCHDRAALNHGSVVPSGERTFAIVSDYCRHTTTCRRGARGPKQLRVRVNL
jgi:hypothetical protein